MRVPTRPSSAAQASLTPMIDVVFLLIIFFLVSSHLARRENHLPVDLPLATTAPPMDPESQPLVITVTADAAISVAGQVIPQNALIGVLSDWARRDDVTAAIRIRSDGTVAYSAVEPILRLSAKAGITDASIAVIEGNTIATGNASRSSQTNERGNR